MKLFFPDYKSRRNFFEKIIEWILFLCALSSVLITFGIVFVLLKETLPFFKEVALAEFFTGTEWTPLFSEPRFGILPLVCGTLMTTVIALSIAIPCGLTAAVFLSEFSKAKTREIVKPLLELLAALPTVVYGYFALLFITPLLQKLFPELSS